MRGRPQAGRFVAIEPRLSLTGANADEWIAVRPGGELALALALVHVIAGENLGAGAHAEARDLVEAYAPEAVAAQTGVEPARVTALAREFAKARPSLAVAGGIAAQSEQSVALHAAVNLLNWVAGNVGETVRFEGGMNLAALRPFSDLPSLIDRMGKGEVAVLVVDGANPVYATPAWAGFGPAMDKVPLKVSLSTVMDETTAHCDLVLPGRPALESSGDDQPAR